MRPQARLDEPPDVPASLRPCVPGSLVMPKGVLTPDQRIAIDASRSPNERAEALFLAFGPRVQATVAMLGGRFRLSRRETSGVTGQVFGVPISIGSVDALCEATGEGLAPVTAALVATLPTAPLLHADGTRWPHDGRHWWLWMVRSAQATVFLLSPSRGGRVIRELTLADYHGVVTSDRYAGDNWLDPA